jgi:hypothetical protein
MRRRGVLLAFAAIVAGGAAAPGPDDRAAVERVIRDQLAAFARDDGAAAYALAAPSIRRLFPTVEIFMRMVANGYRPVYRARSAVFRDLVVENGLPVQRVLLTGPDGRVWLALYTMERQQDGAWLIAGCTLLRPAETGA